MAKIDGTTSELALKRYGIRGFPTIMLLHKGRVWGYEGRRTVEGLQRFVEAPTNLVGAVPSDWRPWDEAAHALQSAWDDVQCVFSVKPAAAGLLSGRGSSPGACWWWSSPSACRIAGTDVPQGPPSPGGAEARLIRRGAPRPAGRRRRLGAPSGPGSGRAARDARAARFRVPPARPVKPISPFSVHWISASECRVSTPPVCAGDSHIAKWHISLPPRGTHCSCPTREYYADCLAPPSPQSIGEPTPAVHAPRVYLATSCPSFSVRQHIMCPQPGPVK